MFLEVTQRIKGSWKSAGVSEALPWEEVLLLSTSWLVTAASSCWLPRQCSCTRREEDVPLQPSRCSAAEYLLLHRQHPSTVLLILDTCAWCQGRICNLAFPFSPHLSAGLEITKFLNSTSVCGPAVSLIPLWNVFLFLFASISGNLVVAPEHL